MENNDTLDSLFHAMADPTRRAVVARLAQGPATVSDLAGPHDITLPTLLKHLKVLEASGLVRSEKLGRVRTCHIEAARLTEAEAWIAMLRHTWSRRLDRLATIAEGLAKAPPAPDPQGDPE